MSVDRDFVLGALLQQNFLPAQKPDREELPPILSSVSFTPDVARRLLTAHPRHSPDYKGYDTVDYRLTRFNGVPRTCSIPHPVAFSAFAMCVYENWNLLDYVSSNPISLIRPRWHEDGRLLVMDYEKSFERSERHFRSLFGRRFVVRADISNFFPSVYSHAVAWATVGFPYAKSHMSNAHRLEWFNVLDFKLRQMKRGETQGVAIGPATSNIVSEAILARVDESLKSDFAFVRFIDDYTAYCSTEEQAQRFVRRLSEELARYKLVLNINKTKVLPLPLGLVADWIPELSLALPAGPAISGDDASKYLSMAVRVAREVPDGSVLKYALKSLLRQGLTPEALVEVLQYGLTLSFHHPVLLPLLTPLFDATTLTGRFPYANELELLALSNARFRRSDGMAWTLYYFKRYGVPITSAVVDEVIGSRDCIALLLLYCFGDAAQQAAVVAFATSLDGSNLYELDEYWLLLYELFRESRIPNPYGADDAFAVMAAESVGFVQPS